MWISFQKLPKNCSFEQPKMWCEARLMAKNDLLNILDLCGAWHWSENWFLSVYRHQLSKTAKKLLFLCMYTKWEHKKMFWWEYLRYKHARGQKIVNSLFKNLPEVLNGNFHGPPSCKQYTSVSAPCWNISLLFRWRVWQAESKRFQKTGRIRYIIKLLYYLHCIYSTKHEHFHSNENYKNVITIIYLFWQSLPR